MDVKMKIKKKMERMKLLVILIVFMFYGKSINAQYLERNEIVYFEGEWIANLSESDSIILEMKFEKKFPIKSETWDTGYKTDVLLMNLIYYKSGEKFYSPKDLETKYKNQFFVAKLGTPMDINKAVLNFTYNDDLNNSLGGSGRGRLVHKEGVLEMEIDNSREGANLKLPNKDANNRVKYNSRLSIPKKIIFIRKD